MAARLWILRGVLAAILVVAAAGTFGRAATAGPVAFYPAAAVAALDCQSVQLTAPAASSVLTGDVKVRGRAFVQDFRFYKVEYSLLDRAKWTLIGVDVVRQPVQDGQLVIWPTSGVADGDYRLRMHVVNGTGNYCEVVLSPLTVRNSRAAEPETETPTETPVLTAVPVLTTPTVYVVIPTDVSPARGTTSALPTRTPAFGLDMNLTVLGAFFVFGVSIMFAVLLFIGAIFFVRYWR